MCYVCYLRGGQPDSKVQQQSVQEVTSVGTCGVAFKGKVLQLFFSLSLSLVVVSKLYLCGCFVVNVLFCQSLGWRTESQPLYAPHLMDCPRAAGREDRAGPRGPLLIVFLTQTV